MWPNFWLLVDSSPRDKSYDVSDFNLLLPSSSKLNILFGMRPGINRISQPGWTGKLGAQRIVKAVQRTSSFANPGSRRPAVAVSRKAPSCSWMSLLNAMPPVSVTLRDIETGAAMLAQRQYPRALQRFNVDAKVRKLPLRRDNQQ